MKETVNMERDYQKLSILKKREIKGQKINEQSQKSDNSPNTSDLCNGVPERKE